MQKKVYCRIFQGAFHLALPVMPYREPVCLDSLAKLPNLMTEKGIKSVLLVTDEFLSSTDGFKTLEKSLKEKGINCAVYSKTCPNPIVHNVEDAREIYVKEKCEALIAYGGGSPMDCAKGVGARIAYPNKPMSKLKGLLKVLKKYLSSLLSPQQQEQEAR